MGALCTLSGPRFVYSFSFLGRWSIQDEYIKNHYRVIAVDLSEQKELDVDSKEVQ